MEHSYKYSFIDEMTYRHNENTSLKEIFHQRSRHHHRSMLIFGYS